MTLRVVILPVDRGGGLPPEAPAFVVEMNQDAIFLSRVPRPAVVTSVSHLSPREARALADTLRAAADMAEAFG
jgi:hypothetical protein